MENAGKFGRKSEKASLKTSTRFRCHNMHNREANISRREVAYGQSALKGVRSQKILKLDKTFQFVLDSFFDLI
jgi:hypothetical protein